MPRFSALKWCVVRYPDDDLQSTLKASAHASSIQTRFLVNEDGIFKVESSNENHAIYIDGLICSKPAHGSGTSIESHVQIRILRYTLECPAPSQLERKDRDGLVRACLQEI